MIEIGGNAYKIGKLDAFKQFHVVRRIGGPLVDLGIEFLRVQDGKGEGWESILRSAVHDLGKLSDADADYVLLTCLSVVERQRPQDGGWSPVAPSRVLMFQDIDMATMLQLVWAVLESNLESFFAMLPQPSTGSEGAAEGGSRSFLSRVTKTG